MAGRDKKRPPIFVLISKLTSEPIMMRLQRHLSAADLLSLFSSPIQLLPPPGPNKYYVVWLYSSQFHPGTTPYTLNGNTVFYLNIGNWIGNISDPLVSNLSGTDPTVSQTVLIGSMNMESNVDNLPIQLTLDAAELTDGDGTVDTVLYYTIETYV